MDNTDKIKSEIRAILDSATDKELTKQWIVEALGEGLHLKPDCTNSKSEALNPTITFGTNQYKMELESGSYDLKGKPVNFAVTESAPSFIDKCEVKVDPNNKPSVKSKIKDMAINQLIGQGIRELIDWLTNCL